MRELERVIHESSIDNLRVGTVVSCDHTRYSVRIGTATVVCYAAAGLAVVGQTVTLECPEGDLTKAHLVARAPLVLAEGGNVIL
jgi:hypothetical protein